MLKTSCYSSQYCFTFFCSFSWRLTESVCSTNALPIAMHRQARTLFLFTYAKIPHVSVHTHHSQIQYIRYGSSSLYASQPLAQLRRRGPFPKLLWADLFNSVQRRCPALYVALYMCDCDFRRLSHHSIKPRKRHLEIFHRSSMNNCNILLPQITNQST